MKMCLGMLTKPLRLKKKKTIVQLTQQSPVGVFIEAK